MKSILQRASPDGAPRAWLLINAVCLLWSVLLLIVLCVATDEDSWSRRMAQEQYLVYNLMTTIIWVTEIGLTVYVAYGWVERMPASSLSVSSIIEYVVELLMAAYFLLDSIAVVVQHRWVQTTNNKNDNGDDGSPVKHMDNMTLAAVVGVAAYLYMTIHCAKRVRREQMITDQGFEALGDDNEHGQASQNGMVAV